ncbi:hypothetical protein GCM10028810_21100 [Spirosoma litoris]
MPELEQQVHYDVYALLDIDVPWIADGLRDQRHRRAEMLARFRAELDRRKLPYLLVSASYPERFITLKNMADKLLGSD